LERATRMERPNFSKIMKMLKKCFKHVLYMLYAMVYAELISLCFVCNFLFVY
jgi:hypothetical protein